MSGALAGEAPVHAGELASFGASPWALARRRLVRNRIAMTMLGVLVVIVLLCLAAPLYAKYVAHTHPFESNLDGTTIVNGKTVPVMKQESGGLGLGVTPIGPTWDPHHYMFGADDQGLLKGRFGLYVIIPAAEILKRCDRVGLSQIGPRQTITRAELD